MTEFDEYEYLEKSVDEHANGNGEAKSSKRAIDGDVPDGKSKRGRASEEDPRSSRRERERDRDLGNGKEHRHASRERDRGKERERDRPRERDRVDRERDRVGDRGDRGGGRGGDRDFDRGADRGGGRGDGYREKHREPYRERPVERPPRETKEQPLFEKERRDPRERRDNRKKEEEEVEVDPERDQRTVFAYQISLKADERDVYEFFSRAGKVRDVRLIMDRNSRRSKGVGYIEFYDVMSVPMAITLSGQPLMGQGVMVKPSEAEKNLVQPSATAAANAMTAATVGMMGFAGSGKRLYVGNLHVNMSEDALRQVFEPFGLVEQVQLPTNPESKECKGFGFVQYVRPDDARAAMTSLDGLELAGQKIKVSAVSDNVGVTEAVPENEKLDDEEGGGLTLNARSRAMLMAKLDRSGVPIPPVAAPTLAGMPGLLPGMPGALSSPVPMMMPLMPGGPGLGMPGGIPGLVAPGMVATMENPGLPTEYLLLKNMFDPTTETEPDFDEDIKDDVTEECSKFGQVKHIYVEKASGASLAVGLETSNTRLPQEPDHSKEMPRAARGQPALSSLPLCRHPRRLVQAGCVFWPSASYRGSRD